MSIYSCCLLELIFSVEDVTYADNTSPCKAVHGEWYGSDGSRSGRTGRSKHWHWATEGGEGLGM